MKKTLLMMLSAVVLFAANTIVTVNGRAITDEIVPEYNKLDTQKKEVVKQELVNEELLMAYALKSNIVKDKNFKKIFAAQKAQIEKMYKQKFNKSLTPEQIRNIKGSIAVKMLLAKKAQKIKVTDKDAKKFYTKNKKKFMMPESVEIASIATKDKKEAYKIEKQLKKAKNIPAALMKIAKKKHQRGYLGWLPKQAFPADVFKKLYNTKANTLIKEPIVVNGVYNVTFVVNKRKAGLAKFNEVKDNLKPVIAQQRVAKWAKNKLEELRKKAIIK